MAFNVTLLLCEGMLISSSTLAAEIFQFAQAMARAQRHPVDTVKLTWLIDEGDEVTTSAGFKLPATSTLDQFEAAATPCDLIHIPALWRNPRPALARHRRYLGWLTEQQQRNTPIAAVGTGVCFLAAAGLLDGRDATTHWHYFDQMQRDYPAVNLQRQLFATRTGNLYCAASVNAMAEVMMGLVERVFGRVIARQAQRNFFHEIRNITPPAERRDDRHRDETIVQLQIWLQDNLHREVRFDELAAQFGLSLRTFNRRFKAALGQTPGHYLVEQRLQFACELLRDSDLSIGEVAARSGFENANWFAQRFKQWSGSTARDYRRTVRGKLFGGQPGATHAAESFDRH